MRDAPGPARAAGPGGPRRADLPCVPDLACGPAARHRVIRLGACPESPRAARGFTARTLASWQLQDLAADAVTVASELVTNAIVHGRSPAARHGGSPGPGAPGPGEPPGVICLAWQWHGSRVVCVVTDENPVGPVPRCGDPGAESGRGLQVVQALALAWGWLLVGSGGKAVWASLPARWRPGS